MARRAPLASDAPDGLALALIESSDTPLLLLDGSLRLIAASASFCRNFGIIPSTSEGKALGEIGTGEWNMPQLRCLLEATARGQRGIAGYEMDLERPGKGPRRLILNAHKLDFGQGEAIRLIVTVADVTDARLAEKLKDDLLREKAILLRELQHRVANSLQIIASVLMQSARRVQSDETRSHLYDAHTRVLSVARIQQHLAVARLGEVEIKPYLTELCESIAASMILDKDRVSLDVTGDTSVTSADISVSIGLVVTELVINALKHAFPAHRSGHIKVDYRSTGAGWTLGVGDDGVGMPATPFESKAGLGTSIVEALARTLDAKILVAKSSPGTLVTLTHK